MAPRRCELDGAPQGEPCTIDFEGKALSANVGEPLAVTLLAHGIETASRSVKYHRPRGPFCLAGACGQCWMRIDDLPNRAACTAAVHPNMTVIRENAFPSADFDVFRAADHLFAGGLDHHRLGTTPIRPLNVLMQDTARRMAGLGQLSMLAPAPAPEVEAREVEVLVIGSGPAGLAAAGAIASFGVSIVLIEAMPALGGQLRTKLYEDVPELAELPARSTSIVESRGGEVWGSSIASGVYREDPRATPVILVRRNVGTEKEHLAVLAAKQLVIACGGYEQSPLFEANDLPGHYGARALAELVLGFGILPGSSRGASEARVVIADGGTETGGRLHRSLKARGIRSIRVIEDTLEAPSEDVHVGKVIVAARGGTHVKGVEIAAARGSETARSEGDHAPRIRIACDVIASAIPVAPAFELARQAGCAIAHRPDQGGFAVVIDPRSGRTSIDTIYAAGDVTGSKSASLARIEGEIVGLSVVLDHRDDAGARGRRDDLLASVMRPHIE